MQELLDNLLIGEVAEISGANLPSLKQWIDRNLIEAPPVIGKHRRFSARHTIQAVVMNELTRLGIRPAVVSRGLPIVTFRFLWYIDTASISVDGRVTMEDCAVRFWLHKGESFVEYFVNIETLPDVIETANLPQYSLIIRFGPIFRSVLTKALAVQRAREQATSNAK